MKNIITLIYDPIAVGLIAIGTLISLGVYSDYHPTFLVRNGFTLMLESDEYDRRADKCIIEGDTTQAREFLKKAKEFKEMSYIFSVREDSIAKVKADKIITERAILSQ